MSRIRFDPALPISARRDEIRAAVERHPVVIVCGETGSGKTTQLPKMLLEMSLGANAERPGRIGHTQPRRIAARAVAARVAQELGTELGGVVGCKIRFHEQVGSRTAIKLMTDGILLAETQGDRDLRQYAAIILDEAHERSLNIDFLIGYMKQLVARRPELRVVITSATLRRHGERNVEILPLYARLSAAEQDRVFKPAGARRVVLATNVAETSLTVPRIRYVVDTGDARVKRYSYRNKVEMLRVEPISQAAAKQRAGRCGRVANGVCIRLYSEEDFAKRPAFTDPELLRSSLASVILRAKSLGLGEVADFPFLDPPIPRAIADGYALLHE